MSTVASGRYAGLPKECPSWCLEEHKRAVDEGAEIENASRHMSNDHVGRGYTMELQQEHAPNEYPPALVRLELAERDGDRGYRYAVVNLSSADARRMAAQLLHLADAEDFGASKEKSR